jgi:antigen flippase
VRAASAFEGQRRREFVRTAACIFASATLALVLVMLAAPQWVARRAGLPPAGAGAVRWLALALAFSSLFVFGSALLNALGRIGDLALLQVIAAAAMAAGAGPAARSASEGRPGSLAWLLGFSAAVSAVAAGWALLRFRAELKNWFYGPGRRWAPEAAKSFASLSLAMLASGLAASGVLLAVRGRIASRQGMAVTGQFDAAWAISMNYVSLVLASLQTYYLPTLARARGGAQRNAHISSVLTLATMAAAVLIAAVACLKPRLLTWFYSAEFRPGAEYLRWTLLGDYLKVSSWILSIPILAAAEMKVFLAADLAAYGVFLGAAAGLTLWLTAAASAGAAFVLMYAAHLLICAVYLLRCQQFVPTRTALLAWTAGLAVVVVVSALTWNQK